MRLGRLRELGFRPWLLILIGAVTLEALRRSVWIADPAAHQHWVTYMRAAASFADGQSPYQVDLGYGRDFWFYAPSAGLFFWPFLKVQQVLGASWAGGLFLCLSALVAALGYLTARPKGPRPLWSDAIFVGLLFPALTWFKFEPLLLGGSWILAFRISDSKRGREVLGFFWGLITSWKLQGLAWAGLYFSSRTWFRRPQVLVAFAAGLLIPLSLTPQWSREWLASLQETSADRFLQMESLYHTLATLGFEGAARGLYALAPWLGLLLAAFMFRATPKGLPPHVAFGIGSAVLCTLAPIHQNNAWILSVPLFLALERGGLPRVWLALSFFVMAFSYTWPLPTEAQEALRGLSFKTGWVAGMTALGWRYLVRPARS